MKTIYVDKNYKCHAVFAEGLTPVDDSFFDGKCDAFIEGYCYDTSKGYTQIYPWKDEKELFAAQREYEKARLADAENALAILYGGVSV